MPWLPGSPAPISLGCPPFGAWAPTGEPTRRRGAACASASRASVPIPLVSRSPSPLPLDTAECLAMVEQARPHAPIRELRDLLEQLDRVAFASAHGTDISALALMARRLAKDVAA